MHTFDPGRPRRGVLSAFYGLRASVAAGGLGLGVLPAGVLLSLALGSGAVGDCGARETRTTGPARSGCAPDAAPVRLRRAGVADPRVVVRAALSAIVDGDESTAEMAFSKGSRVLALDAEGASVWFAGLDAGRDAALAWPREETPEHEPSIRLSEPEILGPKAWLVRGRVEGIEPGPVAVTAVVTREALTARDAEREGAEPEGDERTALYIRHLHVSLLARRDLR